jgi:hypothetical protein
LCLNVHLYGIQNNGLCARRVNEAVNLHQDETEAGNLSNPQTQVSDIN